MGWGRTRSDARRKSESKLTEPENWKARREQRQPRWHLIGRECANLSPFFDMIGETAVNCLMKTRPSARPTCLVLLVEYLILPFTRSFKKYVMMSKPIQKGQDEFKLFWWLKYTFLTTFFCFFGLVPYILFLCVNLKRLLIECFLLANEYVNSLFFFHFWGRTGMFVCYTWFWLPWFPVLFENCKLFPLTFFWRHLLITVLCGWNLPPSLHWWI